MNPIKGFILPSTSPRKFYQYLLLYEFPQMSSDRCTIYSRIAVKLSKACLFTILVFFYSTTKSTDRLRRQSIRHVVSNDGNKLAIWWFFLIFSKMYLLPHHIVQYNAVVNVFPWPSQSKDPTGSNVFRVINIVCILYMSSRKMIAVSEKTYKDLAEVGNLEDSFDSVIARLIPRKSAGSKVGS